MQFYSHEVQELNSWISLAEAKSWEITESEKRKSEINLFGLVLYRLLLVGKQGSYKTLMSCGKGWESQN